MAANGSTNVPQLIQITDRNAQNGAIDPTANLANHKIWMFSGTVDSVVKLGMNHPMGPLELADFIGLDVCLDIMEVLFEGFGDPKFRPCPLLRKMVAAGWLGKKSGRGFYIYAGK